MKKAVIFGYTMEMGGAERALINILNILVKHYEVDLILLKSQGILMNSIPKDVNVIQIRNNILSYLLFRYIPFFRKRKIRKLTNTQYDLAISFMEGRAATWLIDMKQDCKKIAWIHNDVNKFNIGISEKEIKNTYSKVDNIIVVSNHSKYSFINKYKINEDKVEVIYNLINEDEILKKSTEQKILKEKFTFINVSKMRPQKRHDRLLKAVSILKEEGFDFQLLLVGNGPLEKEVTNMVQDLNISDYVTLLGLKENPFPYIKSSDYFVLSSDHEGYPLSLLESLILKTPVISTDVSGAKEILKDNKYGFICEVNLDSLVNSMRKVLLGKDKQIFNIEKNLEKYKGANKGIIEQLENLFNINE